MTLCIKRLLSLLATVYPFFSDLVVNLLESLDRRSILSIFSLSLLMEKIFIFGLRGWVEAYASLYWGCDWDICGLLRHLAAPFNGPKWGILLFYFKSLFLLTWNLLWGDSPRWSIMAYYICLNYMREAFFSWYICMELFLTLPNLKRVFYVYSKSIP